MVQSERGSISLLCRQSFFCQIHFIAVSPSVLQPCPSPQRPMLHLSVDIYFSCYFQTSLKQELKFVHHTNYNSSKTSKKKTFYSRLQSCVHYRFTQARLGLCINATLGVGICIYVFIYSFIHSFLYLAVCAFVLFIGT